MGLIGNAGRDLPGPQDAHLWEFHDLVFREGWPSGSPGRAILDQDQRFHDPDSQISIPVIPVPKGVQVKVLVLGCGPAGLMAVHAASMLGHDVVCVSKARKSFMKGAQYLHAPIPLATARPTEPFTVSYELRGSSSAYREKVYGRDYDGTVSPEDLTESHDGWDIRETYDWLWETYGSFVFDDDDLGAVGRIPAVLNWAQADVVISTIPAPLLCQKNKMHLFNEAKIWSTSGVDDLWGEQCPDNTVICNAEDSPAWYRLARIQGHMTVEWPHSRKPPIPGLHEVSKPLSTTCTCFRDIVRMGRYGRWQKGVLSHEAFFQTLELLQAPEQMRLDIES